MGATFGIIAFVIIVAVIAWRHDKKIKAPKFPVRVPTEEQRDNFDKNHPNL